MSTIRLRNVTKRFGSLVAVNRAISTWRRERCCACSAPPAARKTTTLRMIAGLEDATEGDILVAERRVNHLRPSQRDIAMVFQFYALYPVLTVAENLALPRSTTSEFQRRRSRERVNRVASLLHLESVLQRTPGQLAEGRSSGRRSGARSSATRTASCSTSP